MRIVAFITDAPALRDILAHLGEPTAPPRIAPARGAPLWEQAAAEWVDPHPPSWTRQPSPHWPTNSINASPCNPAPVRNAKRVAARPRSCRLPLRRSVAPNLSPGRRRHPPTAEENPTVDPQRLTPDPRLA